MTTTPPEAPTGPEPAGDPGPQDPYGGPRASGSDIKDLARLRRTTGPHKKIAGVAGGLARHLDIDPLVLRVALVVLVFFGGAGIIVYGACWLLVPEDGDDRAPFNFDDRTRAVALVIAGVIAGLALIGDTMGGYGFPWPLAILALVVLVVVAWSDRDKPRPTAPPVPQAPPYAPAYTQSQQGWVQPASTATWEAQPWATQPIQQPVPPAPPVRYRNPRKRGPILFWWTLALAALGIGVLGMADAAGAPVADSAYPALVVATCGVMLLVGAFVGRAGGLIFVGLVAALGLAGATASTRWDDRVVRTPQTAAAVQDRYEIGAGELVLDLTDVRDLEGLDGRSIELDVGLGRVEVIVPEGLDVDVEGQAGLGDAEVFGDRQEGAGVNLDASHDGGVGVPEIMLDIQVGLGEIDVVVDTNGADR
jgi:phage shock protein PspC (stress-responsive transcriptional regulator)